MCGSQLIFSVDVKNLCMILHISDSKPNDKYHFASIQYLYPLPERARREKVRSKRNICQTPR